MEDAANYRAPDLILDLLATNGRALTTAQLIRAGALMGIQGNAVKVALHRLVACGKVVVQARARYRANLKDNVLLAHLVGWYQREEQLRPWAGEWLFVHDDGVPRADKTAWRRHELAMRLGGYARLSGSLWLRPDNRLESFAQGRLGLLALGMHVKALALHVDQWQPPSGLALAELWQSRARDRRYAALLKSIEASREAILSGLPLAEAARQTLLLGRSIISELAMDPLLPPELHPPDMHAELYARTRAYQLMSIRIWRRWLGSAQGASTRAHRGPAR
ncbi:PaaX family transcriptional regulator [Corticibacter populi]|uniref:PaaX family transcriptional regulator n=1 Tax=Corticibacter populi TaxID=1550736 RepID=A0A3M6QRH0_9BURK|nr:PaaX family transcriptional regulator [Corticibacter populi]RMX05648.1 PaaX family transcriptional regulator [Corticibacter populi]RZS31075.1 phenylacetic acid degradation operon negative regulatory protein [Corticibacter populi]